MRVIANNSVLTFLDWGDEFVTENANHITTKTCEQLDEYFTGKRKVFELNLQLTGTDFQQQAWQVLQTIPYAKTLSYGGQANIIRRANAVRAIGAANGRNPISIIVPCHRVIGASGKLIGYGGGLERKEFLLELEKKYA
jgi:methylated-DNA-[protein]-cysteine S-methyltransferase